MVLEIIIAGGAGVVIGSALGAVVVGLWSGGKVAHELKVNEGLNFVLAARANRIAELEKEVLSLREAEEKAAKVRSAIAKAGGLARGMKQRKIAEQKANAARDRTMDSLVRTPLRPHKEVVAGVREARRERAGA